jgi:hypothetical protein
MVQIADRPGFTARLAATPLWLQMTFGALSVALSAFIGLVDM